MKLCSLALIIIVIIIMKVIPTDAVSFLYNGFGGTNRISLSGIAKLDRGLVVITNESSFHAYGRAFYPFPIHIKDSSASGVSSFSSEFVFSITPMLPELGGHGIAFVMSPTLDSTGVLPVQYLGILNSSDNGNSSNHVFAVEFDTVQDFDMGDINDNHVGVDLNSMISTCSTAAGYWAQSQNVIAKRMMNLKGGDIIRAWVDYDGHKQQLNVTISPLQQLRPQIPLLSLNLSLADVLKEYTYIGFSASTGIVKATHRLLAWSFSSDGAAKSIDLSKLPSVSPRKPLVQNLRFKILVSFAVSLVIAILGSAVGLLLYRRGQREIVESWELELRLHRYSYKDLAMATRGFDDDELLGAGGFGSVYKGVLPNSGLEVAVKRLSRASSQGEREFVAEMASMGRLRHRHLVQLLGWSRCRARGELLLVYEYMPNGSLDRLLFENPSKALRWEQRERILKGVAAGILHLHDEWEQQILHRDIKASNVLLDLDMNAKLGDFGLARLYEHGHHPHTTKVVGTLGYLAPEFARTGKPTTSTDVYSFGALLLEVATGHRPLEHRGDTQQNPTLLVEEVWGMHRNGRLLEAVDEKLDGFFNVEEVKKVLKLGLLCSHPNPTLRPRMSLVVAILNNEAPIPPLPTFCTNSTSQDLLKDGGGFDSLSSFSANSCSILDQTTQISAR